MNESKRIQAENAGILAHWYNQLVNVVKDTPARLVYSFMNAASSLAKADLGR
jgi:hypothetical protein